MYIKVWNNHDRSVLKITPSLKKFYFKEVKRCLSKEELSQIKKFARVFAEDMALVFIHNLKRGWENKLLANGEVTTKSNCRLSSKEEIGRALDSDGEIQFHAYRRFGSCAFIKELLKPAHLRWS